jgi:hypothetical protein
MKQVIRQTTNSLLHDKQDENPGNERMRRAHLSVWLLSWRIVNWISALVNTDYTDGHGINGLLVR